MHLLHSNMKPGTRHTNIQQTNTHTNTLTYNIIQNESKERKKHRILIILI